MAEDAEKSLETLIDRVEQRIAALSTTDRAVSMLVTGKPDLIRDMRRRNIRPKNIEALAEALETSVEWLVHGVKTGSKIGDRRSGYDAAPGDLQWPVNRTMPVYGTALAGGRHYDDGKVEVETHIVEQTERIDWIRRPAALEGRRDVYALYIYGSSMEPRYEPGDPVIVDPKRSPRPGDDVIVQLARPANDADETFAALIKTLVRRSASFVELKQYNPPITFTVPMEQVAAIHRVLARRDLVG